ncbi:MAG: hypothetical protein NDI66_07195, partial [Pseudomonas sp.]|nr:hypothetical protein [Pseudomonas sp.]
MLAQVPLPASSIPESRIPNPESRIPNHQSPIPAPMPYSHLNDYPADIRQRAERIALACFDVD